MDSRLLYSLSVKPQITLITHCHLLFTELNIQKYGILNTHIHIIKRTKC
jgi:hypothetical protein